MFVFNIGKAFYYRRHLKELNEYSKASIYTKCFYLTVDLGISKSDVDMHFTIDYKKKKKKKHIEQYSIQNYYLSLTLSITFLLLNIEQYNVHFEEFSLCKSVSFTINSHMHTFTTF